MLRPALPTRMLRAHAYLVLGAAVLVLATWHFRSLLLTTAALASMPLAWWRDSAQFLISAEADGFDVTFANYSRLQPGAGPGFEDRIPPVLHHIALGGGAGSGGAAAKWRDARQACLDVHPGWDAHLWTDENATLFVAERFPQLVPMWNSYRYPIQRIDALRYLVLYEYGGVVLDMDLKCKRSLGPLRRFSFVAPAAHPTGVSNGFLMAPKQSPFIGSVIHNLRRFNRHWLFLPYPSVMFSTGCHYLSTIHTLQRNRSALKVLAGPKDDFRLHSLNGIVSTPLFDHLGSSSWHSFDAALIVWFGHLSKTHVLVLASGVLANVCVVAWMVRHRVWRRLGLSSAPLRRLKSSKVDYV